MIETAATNELAEQLRRLIKREGPITFRDWMKAALYDPENGYYCRRDRRRWGREGDYRTSPERSGLFGATLAHYFAKLYDEMGQPPSWTIFEFGAGDGQFAAGALRALELYNPKVFQAKRYVIDEVSLESQSRARKRLLPFADRVLFKSFHEVEIDCGVVFSNELLDAFPVHRVKMAGGQLSEFYVDIGADGKFVWTIGAPSAPGIVEYFESCGVELGEGQIAEFSPEIEDWLKNVADRIRAGYVITVDYGADSSELYPASPANPRYSGTLRSFQRHQLIDDVLSNPGEQDLTTTVNWSFVRSVGEKLGFKVVEFERQDKFLLAAGLLDQLESESQRTKSEAEKLRLSNAALEMILPTGMASSFQVLVQKKG
jgi:SAM-dependent MidA family methyltransferase